jgi:hypothetical protein
MFSNTHLRVLIKMIQPPMMTHGERVVLNTLGDKDIVTYASHERKLHTISMAIDQFFDRCEDTVRYRTESAHLHVVSGVSSCYAVKPSAL